MRFQKQSVRLQRTYEGCLAAPASDLTAAMHSLHIYSSCKYEGRQHLWGRQQGFPGESLTR